MAAAGLRFLKAVALVLAPVALAAALYSPRGFSPAPMPPEYSYGPVVTAPVHQDFAYDAADGWLYTGCADGWVSVPAGDVVEDWARTGRRPLGVALAADGGLVVADAAPGLPAEFLATSPTGATGTHALSHPRTMP
ncbi:protein STRICTOSIDINE SYNTHASE-LIKE 5-like [Panicum virgatum]|uniref:protein STRICTOSIDINE SYNTHASE-LIKE 5-like n=1 Tax=Panicum virgatum TaxID=38727 RepID=UPI0019D54221|nr:protein STRICTOSIDINE SYNTHASE-LIKE 5-like [Panicum virgatum]